LDGEWLFAESYDPKRIQRAHGIVVSEKYLTGVAESMEALTETLRDRPTYPSQRLLRRFVHGR
jgi:hypothetical protein